MSKFGYVQGSMLHELKSSGSQFDDMVCMPRLWVTFASQRRARRSSSPRLCSRRLSRLLTSTERASICIRPSFSVPQDLSDARFLDNVSAPAVFRALPRCFAVFRSH